MNIGFKTGTKFKTDKVISNVYTFKGEAIELILSNGKSIICGREQLIKTANGKWIEAENLLDEYVTSFLQVVEIREVSDEIELFDITVDSIEHEYTILIDKDEITVHNLSIGAYVGVTKVIKVPVVSTPNVEVQKDTTIYIPETIIQFTVSRLKPNTRLYAFFDGKAIDSSYIMPEGQSWGSSLITDNTGYVAGQFKIPNDSSIKFIAGQRDFILTDSPTNGTDATTFATATYIYTGTTEDQDNPSLETSTTINDYTIDPLIQSFYCNETGGMYISKVGLYFYSKDNNQPLLFQIREIKDDKVLSNYIAGTSLTIYPEDVNISMDPLNLTPTWITFKNPVYLSEGKEYALFIVTNSSNYIMHSVVYGKQTNSVTATKDISSGSLIKYKGVSNWVRDNNSGIKFQIKKCKFDTSNSYTLTLGNVANPTKLLKANAIYIDKDNEKITVTDPDHSFNIGSFVTISGLPDRTYGNIPSNVINGVHRITEVTWNTYSFDNYYEGDVESQIGFTDAFNYIIVDIATTDYDIQYDNLVWNPNYILLSGSSIQYRYKGISGQSIDGNEQPYSIDSLSSAIEPKDMFICSEVKKIASPINSTKFNVPNGKSLQIVATLKTNNENVSPMIDKYNVNAIAVENLINNNSSNEDVDSTGKACARKIWKTVQLYEQATGLKVSFKASVQANSDIKVYYKTLNVGDSGTIDNKPWILMSLSNEVTKSLNSNDYQDYSYMVDDIDPFRSFKTKIVMTSNDSTKVPLVTKYSAIAFAK